MVKRLLIGLAIVGVSLAILSFYSSSQLLPMADRRSNPALKTVKPEWPGTPVDEKGRFVNHEFPFWPTFGEMFRWQTQANPQKAEKKADTFHLAVTPCAGFLQSKQDGVVWLGHASFLIRLQGKLILIDPVLYNVSLVKRLAPLPLAPEQLTGIEYIVISHDHRDHCDEKSLKLLAKQNPQATVLTGLNMAPLLRDMMPGNPVEEAGWYQQFKTKPGEPELIFLPSRHWGRRGLSDTNERLWGAVLIRGGGRTIYFSGDTGYGSHLKEVGDLFGPVDLCLIGIGAYKPEWFMGSNHISPANAYKGFKEMKAARMVPMHYGTFDLSDEPLGDPYRTLKHLCAADSAVKLPAVGEVISI